MKERDKKKTETCARAINLRSVGCCACITRCRPALRSAFPSLCALYLFCICKCINSIEQEILFANVSLSSSSPPGPPSRRRATRPVCYKRYAARETTSTNVNCRFASTSRVYRGDSGWKLMCVSIISYVRSSAVGYSWEGTRMCATGCEENITERSTMTRYNFAGGLKNIFYSLFFKDELANSEVGRKIGNQDTRSHMRYSMISKVRRCSAFLCRIWRSGEMFLALLVAVFCIDELVNCRDGSEAQKSKYSPLYESFGGSRDSRRRWIFCRRRDTGGAFRRCVSVCECWASSRLRSPCCRPCRRAVSLLQW